MITQLSSTQISLCCDATQRYFLDAINALLDVRDQERSGRLSIRSDERRGLIHFYFQEGRLVHIMGDKRNLEALLQDLLQWQRAKVRFDAQIGAPFRDVTWHQAEFFQSWLELVEVKGVVYGVSHASLDGLAGYMTAHLPARPLTEGASVSTSKDAQLALWVSAKMAICVVPETPRFPAVPETPRLPAMPETSLGWRFQVNQALQQAGRLTQDVTRVLTRIMHIGSRQPIG
ncbi:hypothetical protein KSD_39640 [Ktedonobacter sp. SOSP1-85]|uniref:DUF4388 domain-containing protein n=1 Tax=Ktedonobacter sp. SOSP1-85 TaxID=2778367 RepID=UPI0019159FD8|nr:DUF4388 domain-containing protein [Ktedonobacter sp. SOSP1-85]GHO76193.1 hypothetical protein KSD_39640 [Ktedonobacter sp. SOSP1-85]